MIKNIIHDFKMIAERPSMNLPEPTLNCFLSYIQGVNNAVKQKPLAGFQEWLVLRVKEKANVYWWGHIQLLTREMADEQNKISECMRILESFFEYRKRNGLNSIKKEYAAWRSSVLEEEG